jgi:hypothetical protein
MAKDVSMAKHVGVSASRRGLVRSGLAIIAAGAATAALAETRPGQEPFAQEEKIAKALLKYQDIPKDGNHCAICAQFISPDQCKIVEGPINPNGWCGAFAPRQA